MNEFGTRISERRKSLGLSLTELARFMGYSVPYLRDVELGKRHPFGSSVLEKLAFILEMDVRELEVLRAISNGTVEIPMSSKAAKTALALLKRKNDLEESEERKIVEILDGRIK